MITEHDIIALSRRVRDFLDAEIAHLGISDPDYVRRFVAEDIDGDIESVDYSEDFPTPPMPPEGDPSYSMAVHGPRSEAHLIEELERRMADFKSGKAQGVTITREQWEEKVRKLAEKHGIKVPSPDERQVRLTLRLPKYAKDRLEEAAAISGTGVNDFVLRKASLAAMAMVERKKNPPKPGEKAWSTSPPMPREGDPGYSPAVHGPRSKEHLIQLLKEGEESGVAENFSMQGLIEGIREAADGKLTTADLLQRLKDRRPR